MPLELELRAPNKGVLGPIAEVQKIIGEVLPGIRFWKELSGEQQILQAEAKGFTFPKGAREEFMLIRETYRGDYDGPDFSLEFWFGPSDIVDSAYLDVRGRGDAMTCIFELAKKSGWEVINLANRESITAADWQGFQQWRDQSIQRIKSEGLSE
jgi:hypothetical protein